MCVSVSVYGLCVFGVRVGVCVCMCVTVQIHMLSPFFNL